jgi:glycosyltransferase involved in cell wall biosynthesis
MNLARTAAVSRPASSSIAKRDLRLALVASTVAGIETQYRHFRSACANEGVPVQAIEVAPYVDGGWIERLPFPQTIRGTLRSAAGTAKLFGRRPVDAVWTQVGLPLLPFTLTRSAWRRIPIFYTSDSTPRLLSEFGGHYRITRPSTRKGRLAAAGNKLFFSRCRALIPWSRWAAASMISDYGADPARVHVIPPGVDIKRWRPATEMRLAVRERVQLLFVGGDFERKGGPLLLDLFRQHLRDTCDLHLVTRASIAHSPGISVYRDMGPDDDRLLDLYQSCDVLVVPTEADCYSMAAIEAMACRLPVVTSAVGGIPEIIEDGASGSLVAPGDGRALLQALTSLTADASLRRRWGTVGRDIAEQRFDAARQSSAVLELIATSSADHGRRHSP